MDLQSPRASLMGANDAAALREPDAAVVEIRAK